MEARESSSDSFEQKQNAKLFGERPDVIYKTILRCFKKHFLNDFNEVTEFRKMKRRVSMKKHSLRSVVKTYIEIKFSDCIAEDIDAYLLALILPKPPTSHLGEVKEKEEQLWEMINKTLYKFNKQRLNVLLQHHQFSFLLMKFLEDDMATRIIYQKSQNS